VAKAAGRGRVAAAGLGAHFEGQTIEFNGLSVHRCFE
jgi:hypothetical protein